MGNTNQQQIAAEIFFNKYGRDLFIKYKCLKVVPATIGLMDNFMKHQTTWKDAKIAELEKEIDIMSDTNNPLTAEEFFQKYISAHKHVLAPAWVVDMAERYVVQQTASLWEKLTIAISLLQGFPIGEPGDFSIGGKHQEWYNKRCEFLANNNMLNTGVIKPTNEEDARIAELEKEIDLMDSAFILLQAKNENLKEEISRQSQAWLNITSGIHKIMSQYIMRNYAATSLLINWRYQPGPDFNHEERDEATVNWLNQDPLTETVRGDIPLIEGLKMRADALSVLESGMKYPREAANADRMKREMAGYVMRLTDDLPEIPQELLNVISQKKETDAPPETIPKREPLVLKDFVPGFRYQMKQRFGDGTVKTKEEYDAAEWIDMIYYPSDLPYIRRILEGANAQNGLLGVRRMPVIKETENTSPYLWTSLQVAAKILDKYSKWQVLPPEDASTKGDVLQFGETLINQLIAQELAPLKAMLKDAKSESEYFFSLYMNKAE